MVLLNRYVYRCGFVKEFQFGTTDPTLCLDESTIPTEIAIDQRFSLGDSITITNTDSPYSAERFFVIYVNSSGGAVTITLPSVSTFNKKIFHIALTAGANNVTIQGNNVGELIDGSVSTTVTITKPLLTVVSNGTGWLSSSDDIADQVSNSLEENNAGGVSSSTTAIPLITKGDLLVRDNIGNTRINVGTDGYVLSADSTTSSGLKWVSQDGSGLQDNFEAITDPSTTDDANVGYSVGSRWINVSTDKAYICVDSTATSAIWIETTYGTSDIPVASTTVQGRVELATQAELNAGNDSTRAITSNLLPKNNFSATSDPTTTNDSTENYRVGSIWINTSTDIAYICADGTATSAVWIDISQSLASIPSASTITEGIIELATQTEVDDAIDSSRAITPNLLAKRNLTATTAPSASNDNTENYSVGSLWINVTNDRVYFCVDASTGSAIWLLVSYGTSDLPTATTTIQGIIELATQTELNIGTDSIRAVTSNLLAKNNFSASTNPTSTNDSSENYRVGSVWVDITNDQSYICLDATATNAVWSLTSDIASASTTVQGKVELATQVEVDIATDSTRAITSNLFAKNNFTATTVPTTTNDNSENYRVGSVWVDVTNDQSYICLDATATSAIWKQTSFVFADIPLASTTTEGIVELATQAELNAGIDSTRAVTTNLLARNNFSSGSDPTSSNDITQSYRVGSMWVNNSTDQSYICVDNSASSAIWKLTSDIVSASTTVQGKVELATQGEVDTATDSTRAITSNLLPKNNFSATTDPTTTNDSSEDYRVGSVWINTSTDTIFKCADATATGAVWRKMVSGPTSSTDNAIVRFDATSGSLVQNSGVSINDGNIISGATNLQIGNGTKTLPAYSFSTDTDTGLYRDGTGNLEFTLNNSGVLRVQADGRVTISSDIANYDTLVTADNVIPNRKWVLDQIPSSSIFGDGYEYTVDETTSSTTSTTYQQKLSLTTASLTSGTYRIEWYCETVSNSRTGAVDVRIQLNNSTVIGSDFQEPKDINNIFSVNGFVDLALTGSQTIDMDYRRQLNNTTVSIRRARLSIYRVT